MHRRALTAALSGAAVALTGALTGITSVGTAQAAESESPLVLDVPDRVVVRSHDGWVYSSLGVRMTAHDEAFELRAHRPTYREGIQAYWHREGQDPLPLPADAMSSWQGLDEFATIRVLREGKRVRRIQATGCFNGEAHKVGPDGPATNPYPWGCPWNPYTLGSVMGVAEDYSASLLPEWGTNIRLKPGSYELVAGIAPKWRKFFGISAADGRVTTDLVVRKARESEENWRPAARSAAVAPDGIDELEPTTAAPTTESEGAMANEFAPDLRALPAFAINLNDGGTALRFGATVWNGGNGPMVVEGFREEHDHAEPEAGDDHTDHMTAYQYYFDGHGQQTGYDRVGEFAYHAANHNHWHFEDFARYRLLDAQKKLAVRSTKASFCLVATDAVDYTVPNADWRPEYTDLSSQCGGRRSQSLRQVLSNGSGDTYHQYRAGQAFRVGELPDGVYFIAVEPNPDDRDGRNLQELDYTNNDSLRKIRIGTNEATGKRWVRAKQVGVIDESNYGGFFRR